MATGIGDWEAYPYPTTQPATTTAWQNYLAWRQWQIQQHTPTTTGSTVFYPLWQNQTSTAANLITPTIFNTTFQTGDYHYWPTWHENIYAPSIIEERSEAENVRLEQRRRETQELLEKAKIASERAKEILLEHLTPQQRKTVEKNGWFTIEGSKSGKLYRVKVGGVAGNVEELDVTGKAITRLCCHLPTSYPAPDHHLTQKLMLEWDEEEFLRRANSTRLA